LFKHKGIAQGGSDKLTGLRDFKTIITNITHQSINKGISRDVLLHGMQNIPYSLVASSKWTQSFILFHLAEDKDVLADITTVLDFVIEESPGVY
jgi:hypothetical protein